jgi:hypothetical protein
MGTGLSRPAFLAGVAWAAADWSSWATAQPTPAAHEPQLHSAVDAAAAAAPATTVTTLGALAADPQAARLCLGGGVCLDRVELSTCGGRWCAELTPAAFGSTRVYTAQAHHGMTSDSSGRRFTGIECCASVTNEGLRAVAAACTQLTSLDLSFCSWVTDEGLRGVAAACTQDLNLNLRLLWSHGLSLSLSLSLKLKPSHKGGPP